MPAHQHTVTEHEAGQRADIFIGSLFPQFARSTLSKLFLSHHILIDGKPIKLGYKLKKGNQLQVDTSPLTTESAPINMLVLYEDNDVTVIDKPAGVLSHSKGSFNDEATVASFMRSRLNDKSLQGNRAGIVHRLDRGTSGVMICARNQAALSWLQKQFSTRKVKKTYYAVVEGIPDQAEAIIDVPLLRNPNKPRTFIVSTKGKPAQTHYKTLKSWRAGDQTVSLLELKPTTGRTHQLRVHLKHLSNPIVGDEFYGSKLTASRLMLHAGSLEITLPDKTRQIFTVPTPKEFNL